MAGFVSRTMRSCQSGMGRERTLRLVTGEFRPAGVPYRPPARGAPMRLAFVGQSTFFEACALHEQSARMVTRFIEFREGADAHAMVGELARFAPHAVIAFRPEIVPRGAFRGLRAPTLGFLTEPLPRSGGGRDHPDPPPPRAGLRRGGPSD